MHIFICRLENDHKTCGCWRRWREYILETAQIAASSSHAGFGLATSRNGLSQLDEINLGPAETVVGNDFEHDGRALTGSVLMLISDAARRNRKGASLRKRIPTLVAARRSEVTPWSGVRVKYIARQWRRRRRQ